MRFVLTSPPGYAENFTKYKAHSREFQTRKLHTRTQTLQVYATQLPTQSINPVGDPVRRILHCLVQK